MINIKLEIFLGNVSFVILFLIMVLYWVQAIFSIIPKFNLLIFLATFCANLSLFILLVLRWFNYNHFPLSNLYESLIFLSWSFTLIQLILVPVLLKPKDLLSKSDNKADSVKELLLNKTYKASGYFAVWDLGSLKKTLLNYDDKKNDFIRINTILGTIISPIALFTNSFATFSLPKTMQRAEALVPALQSNWLMMHVTVMMLSYTALLCGSLLAITFLIVTWYQSQNYKTKKNNLLFGNQLLFLPFNKNTKHFYNSFESLQNETNEVSFLEDKNSYNLALTNSKQELPINTLTKTLDNLSYRILGIGFPLLTIGILSGAVWANEAWGSYWSWDPKETWAFITWLIFAIYLHARIIKRWEGEKPAILASFGFFIVWICYLGVNLLGTGLHSYGWMQ